MTDSGTAPGDGPSNTDVDLTRPVLESHSRLRTSPENAAGITEALARVGEASQMDRVYVFRVWQTPEQGFLASQIYEWVQADVEPQIENPDLQNVPLDEAGYGRWVRLLCDYQPVFGLVEEFPPEEQPLLTAQSIVSLLVLPIFSQGELWGFVGLDDCSRRKVWTRADVDFLLSVSIGISASVSEHRNAPRNLEKYAADYMAVVQSLLELGSVAGADKPLAESLRQTRARIRVIVAIHRFLLRLDEDASVDSAAFTEFCQSELRRTLDDCGQADLRIQAMSAPFEIPRAFTMDLGVLLHELVLAFASRHPSGVYRGGMSVGIHEERGTAVIKLRLEGAEDAQNYEVPDALGLVLVRRIAQQLAGHMEVPGPDSAARIVIPLRDRETGE